MEIIAMEIKSMPFWIFALQVMLLNSFNIQ